MAISPVMARGRIFVGTAGWAIPRAVADRFPTEGTSLVRYGERFSAAEINSTFWRRHRPGTLERWRDSVPRAFRFAVKVPRTITHERELRGTRSLLVQFFEDIAGLKSRQGPLLLQLPPSLVFAGPRAGTFFALLRELHQGAVVCEARHGSWNQPAADALLTTHGIARVAADPPRFSGGDEPAGVRSIAYFRLHGAPIVYRSAYGAERLRPLAARLRAAARHAHVWCIFDNTASGAAAGDALELKAILAEAPGS